LEADVRSPVQEPYNFIEILSLDDSVTSPFPDLLQPCPCVQIRPTKDQFNQNFFSQMLQFYGLKVVEMLTVAVLFIKVLYLYGSHNVFTKDHI